MKYFKFRKLKQSMNIISITIIVIGILFLGSIILYSCKPRTVPITKRSYSEVKHPEWAKNAVIYEVNIRQYSPEGTFKAFENDLPRLKELGIDILWLMPVFPIGELNRKVSQTKLIEEVTDTLEKKKYLGSYYSTKDYLDINPEFGTLEDFNSLVTKIHELGMYVILDIAVNHTAWDHKWVTEHPEYYYRINRDSLPWNKIWMKDHPEYFKRIPELGMTYPIHPEEFDWWDVAELNFDNKVLRKELVNVFKYWITKYNVDGYRCDYATGIPNDFWDELRPELDKLKPVFMLAEAEIPDQQKVAFDISYNWKFHHLMNDIAKGKTKCTAVKKHFEWVDSIYPQNSYLMQFTSNHDENSWNGTEYERLGEGAKTFAVLAATVPDMLLLYNGQESAFNRRLKFFEKDTISWGNYSLFGFYKTLIQLKKNNKALFNGTVGGKLQFISTNKDSSVLVFVREKDENKVLLFLNVTPKPMEVAIKSDLLEGKYKEIFSQKESEFTKKEKIKLLPWEYRVYTKI